MNGIRHESHDSSLTDLPFFLQVDIERTPFNCFYEQNWHENIEIQLCTSGEGSVILDGKSYVFKKGDIAVVNSNVIHYTGTENYLTYTCLIVGTKWCKQMGFDYNSLNFCEHIKNDNVEKYLTELGNVSFNYEDNLRVAKSNEILLKLLIELVENHIDNKIQVLKSKNFDVIKSTVAYIRENYRKKITLEEIAKAAYCDKYALCKEFKKYTGQTIFESLNQYRCLRAADCLKQGMRVSEAATLCGFENNSFFTKTFKKYMGLTPTEYKKVL